LLTFEEKVEIIESFPELTRNDVSMKRVNYHYKESLFDKTVVIQHLHPNGNGFVYVAGLHGYEPDDRGLVNIREATEEEFRSIIAAAIKNLSEAPDDEAQPIEENWVGPNGEELLLVEEEEFWNLYHGLNLEESFGAYGQATAYLREEKFKQVQNGRDS